MTTLLIILLIGAGIVLFTKQKNGPFKRRKKTKNNTLVYSDEAVKEIEKDEEREQIDNQRYKEFEKLIDELNFYKERDRQERIRKMQLEKLRDPKIINRNLKTKGKMVSFEGKSSYEEVIPRFGWLGKKTCLDVKINYNFGIGMDWSSLRVNKFLENNAVIYLPREDLQLLYLEIISKETSTESGKSILVREFEPEYITDILKRAEEKTRDDINNNRQYYEIAYDNMKSQLKEFVKELGYNDIVFE